MASQGVSPCYRHLWFVHVGRTDKAKELFYIALKVVQKENFSFVKHSFSLHTLMQFLRVDQDKECNMDCSSASRKPLCASDGRTFASRCEFQRAKCRDPQLEVMRGSCKGQSSSAIFD